MSSVSTEDRLGELLLRWDEFRREGRDVCAGELCADCPELADELQRRIAVVRGLEPVLDIEPSQLVATPRDGDPGGSGSDRQLPDDLRTTAVYRPQRYHGHGGLGEVLAAHQEELDRMVALKRIRPDRLHETARRRFLREATITARLQHPGIVPIYGLGQDRDGPFYTMRFIEGQTLQEAIDAFHADEASGRDSGRRALKFRGLIQQFIAVCNTIAYAHDQGVIHRDLKPANIMLGPYGETLVMDWGLAKRLGTDDTDGEVEGNAPSPGLSVDALTATGAVLGTPQYMSPEQARGEPAGPASDLFSLGLVLYGILTGRSPYPEAVLWGGNLQGAVCEAALVPPHRRDPALPGALEAICLKALEARPEERYPSARAFADDLSKWLADEPVSAWREPLSSRVWRWVRKHRTLATTAAALAVFGLFVLSIAYRREARYSANLSHANTEIRRQNIALDAANTALTAADHESERWLGEAFQAIEDYYTAVGASVLRERPDLADLRRRLLEKPRAFYERLTAEYATASSEDERASFRLAKGHFSLGHILHILGEYEQARNQDQSALNLLEAMIARHPDVSDYRGGLARTYNNLGNVLNDIGRPAEAAAAYTQAIVLQEVLVASQPDIPDYRATLAGFHNNLGRVLQETDRLAEAREAFEKGVAAFEVLVTRRPDVPNYRASLALVRNNLGNLLISTGRLSQAEELYTKAIAGYEGLLASQPDVADYQAGLGRAIHNLGRVFEETGRPSKAEGAYTKAIAGLEMLVARQPDVPTYRDNLAGFYTNLGNVLHQIGRAADAAGSHAKAVEGYEALAARWPDLQDYRANLAGAYSNFGRALAGMGRLADADEVFKKALVRFEVLAGQQPQRLVFRSGVGLTLHNLGETAADRGQHEAAVARFREAIGHQRPLVDSRPEVSQFRRYLGGHYESLAVSLRTLGRVDEAADATRERVKLWPGNANKLYDAACAFALCVPIGHNVSHKHSLAEEAMATLRSAISAGYANGARMNRDPDLVPLHEREDFRRLVLDLMDRAMPADPFGPSWRTSSSGR
jgi:serine/threonine-protein kinase